MNTKNSFFTLLQISDSIIPIGSYTQSNGLETYVQRGIVMDSESSKLYLHNMLLYSIMYGDALAVRLAYEYALKEDMEAIKSLDEILYAVKAPREIKQGSSKMCIRFIKLVEKFNRNEIITRYQKLIKSGQCSGQHSIIFGIFAAVSGVEIKDTVRAYLYNSASCIVNNCAKLIPLSQIDGQVILFESHQLMEHIGEKIKDLSLEDLGRCNIGFDIKAMQHENLYSRLYMS